jgi:hypothetical protein
MMIASWIIIIIIIIIIHLLIKKRHGRQRRAGTSLSVHRYERFKSNIEQMG